MKKMNWMTTATYAFVIGVCFLFLQILDLGKTDEKLENTETISIETTVSPESETQTEEKPETESSETVAWTLPSMEEPSGEQAALPSPDVWERQDDEDMSEPTPEPYVPPTVILATDIHYYSPKLTDYQEAFETMVKKDDGKVTAYSPQLVEAFLDEVIAQRPTALVLSGDLTLNGEKVNHQDLANHLLRVTGEGIPVVVIPGNHDINNRNAATYFGTERMAAETIDQEDFREIYEEFGFDQALSRDEASLSYIYPLDEKNWLMMLDSCQYDPVNLVDGKIRRETYQWMQMEMEKAKEAGVKVYPIAHHNLLDESRLYPTECTIEENQTYISLFEQWDVPLFLSGHMHLQRLRQHQGEGIWEAVTSSLSIAPCQYGVIQWKEDGSMTYRTQRTDVSSWAAGQREAAPELLDFETYSDQLLLDTVGSKIYGKLEYLPENQMREMSDLYTQLNRLYCAGLTVDLSQIMKTVPFEQWERNRPESRQFTEMMLIIEDTVGDNNFLEISPSTDISAENQS